MATNQTTNYDLNQWLSTDQVLRTDFNADNAKIDAALATIPKISAGSYTGDGAASQTIQLDFTPKAVYVCTSKGLTYSPNSSGHVYGGLALDGFPICHNRHDVNYPCVEIVTGGFQVYETEIDDYSGVHGNTEDQEYHYLAVG